MTIHLLPPTGPVSVPTVTVGLYTTYADAERAVDYLSDHGFPVRYATIVGTDLRLVESVLGRMTTSRAALAGAGGGVWFGLLIGAPLALVTPGAWWPVLAAGVLGGTLWGAGAAAVAHAATRGRRDFASRRHLDATRYQVTVPADHEDHARRLLMQHMWRTA